MSENLCPCGKPAPHTAICGNCHATLRSDLLAIRDHWDDLTDAMGRVMRFGGNSTKVIGKTQPLPINPHAAEVFWDARNTLTTWARTALQAWPALEHPRSDGAAIAEWLHDASDWFIKDAWVVELADETADLLGRIKRAIDRPSDMHPIGECGHIHDPERTHDGTTCGCACHYGPPGAIPCDPEDCNPDEPTIAAVVCVEQLKAPRDAREVHCKTCGTTHNVETLRLATLHRHRDTVLPMPQLLNLLGIFTPDDRRRTAAKVRQWVKRGRVTDRAVEVGSELQAAYRVGEVLDRLTVEEREAG